MNEVFFHQGDLVSKFIVHLNTSDDKVDNVSRRIFYNIFDEMYYDHENPL